MAVPNSRDKQIFDNPVEESGSAMRIIWLIASVVVGGLWYVTLNKGNDVFTAITSPSVNMAKPTFSQVSPIERSEEIEAVRQSVYEWDAAINNAAARIDGYRDPLFRLVAEMQALQQSMDRLAAIGDSKGRNELVYQFNDRSHRYNVLIAEKSRLIRYQNDLINGRNRLARELNSLQSAN